MVARTGRRRSAQTPESGKATFELERFAWGAPDRLELSGTFAGLPSAPADPPVLVLRGAHETHRLPAVPGDVSGAPENGQPWQAAFVWHEAPSAFDDAALELGGDIAVALPGPGADGGGSGPEVLEVRLREAEPEDAPVDEQAPGAGADRLRLQAELLAVREELREAQAAVQRNDEELQRARADLDAEREGRAADAARFREGLAQVQHAAEAALAAEQSAAQQLNAEVDELRARLEELSGAGAEAERLHAELMVARAEIDGAHGAIAAVRSDAEALLARLAGIGDPRGGEGG